MCYEAGRRAALLAVGITVVSMSMGCSNHDADPRSHPQEQYSFRERLGQPADDMEGNNDPKEVDRLVSLLRKTTSLVLHYRANGDHRSLPIENKQQVADVLLLIQIQRIETASTGGYAKFGPIGEVDFCDSQGRTVVTLGFFKPKILHWSVVGRVYLSNNSFEERMSALASEKEGRHIDLTKKNDPRLGEDW
jgi:hypothetical protein